MMTLPLYLIDAFTTRLFHGNPAAVCPLDAWPSDTLMQQIAAENNLAETAFLVPYWSAKLGRHTLHARQLSARGGELFCQLRGDRVLMSGHAVQYSEGRIRLPPP
jgi:predicted PhzF superfamily epimerase YddE/YHI9